MIEMLLQAERALSVGLIDQAERLYRQAFESDPRNSIAVVGLARVALERGDDVSAYRLARQALRIDPQNAAADRMAARLTEVIAYRGESLPDEAPEAGLSQPVAGAATSSPQPAESAPGELAALAGAPAEPEPAEPVESEPAPAPEGPLRRRGLFRRLFRGR
jgi:tetratricopeptide (TPR) repeat protein